MPVKEVRVCRSTQIQTCSEGELADCEVRHRAHSAHLEHEISAWQCSKHLAFVSCDLLESSLLSAAHFLTSPIERGCQTVEAGAALNVVAWL